MTWLVPWQPMGSVAASVGYAEELRREVSDHHVLFGVAVRAIGLRQDCDDVLYELLDESGRYAVVHLTFSGKREIDPAWPATTIFPNLADFERDCMALDHDDRPT